MTHTTVQTAAGPVAGTLHDGVRRWLSVPYARAERFAAPEPATGSTCC